MSIPLINSVSLRLILFVLSSTSLCVNLLSRIPVAILEIAEIPTTRIFSWAHTITSGTVDIPTASAPMVFKNEISASVS